MKLLYPCAIFLLSVVALSSCKKMPNNGVPFYMKMDSVNVSLTNLQSQGSHMTYKVTDVWLEANTDNLGAYQIPCNYPVLQDSVVRFVATAGIWESGQSSTRDEYPFYAPDTFSIIARPGQQYSHILKFTYKTAAQFTFHEEEQEFANDYNTGPGTTMAIVNGGPGNSNECAKITVLPPDSNIMALQKIKYALPAGNEIWLELDYKCDVPFFMGFVGYFANSSSPPVQTPIIFLNPRTDWNKVYIKLSDAIDAVRADSYSIYFEANRPNGSSGGSVYLDNIKLVHY